MKHSELERQLEGMGRGLMRKLLQAHLDMRQPGQAVEPVRDAAGTPLTPTPWRASSALWGWPALATERQAHPACTRSTAR